MNNIYYALFINADGSDEGMLTPNQLVGIFEREQLLSILRRELMLGHIHGEIPNDIDVADCPPDFFAAKLLAGLDTDNVWVRMVAPNVEDFDSDNGTFINVDGMDEEEQEALIARLVEQEADEADVREAIAQAKQNIEADTDGDEQENVASDEPPSVYSQALVGAARNLLIASGCDHFEYHRDTER